MRWRIVSLLLLATAAPLLAQVRPVRVSVNIDGVGRPAACRAEALAAARLEAVLERVSEAARPALRGLPAGSLDQVFGDEYRMASFERSRQGCRATVEFRVDLDALAELERSLLSEAVPSVPIGVLVRYLINGERASEVGANSDQATNELESALADYGYRMVTLAAAQDDYDRLLSSTEEAFSGIVEWRPGRRQDHEGGVETSLLEDMRAHLEGAVELAPMRDCGGLVLFGELRIEDEGQNPYGQGSQAAARLILQIHRLDNSRPVVLPGNESRQVVGSNAAMARDQARASVVAPVARQIAEQMALRSPLELGACEPSRQR